MTPVNQRDMTNEELSDKIDKVQKVLEERIINLENSVVKLRGYIVGDIANGDKVGLAERVRKIEEWIDARKKFESIIIGAVLVEAIGFILVAINVIMSHLNQ